jgi:hypothetical protein
VKAPSFGAFDATLVSFALASLADLGDFFARATSSGTGISAGGGAATGGTTSFDGATRFIGGAIAPEPGTAAVVTGVEAGAATSGAVATAGDGSG